MSSRSYTKPNSIELPPNWRYHVLDTGEIYYYHVITKQTQWEKPTREQAERETPKNPSASARSDNPWSKGPSASGGGYLEGVSDEAIQKVVEKANANRLETMKKQQENEPTTSRKSPIQVSPNSLEKQYVSHNQRILKRAADDTPSSLASSSSSASKKPALDAHAKLKEEASQRIWMIFVYI